jgi:hypothetical protein
VVTVSIVFNLQALYVVAATIVTLLVYVTYLKVKDRRVRGAMRKVTGSASNYLKNNSIDAHVTSYPVLGGRRFVVLIEARPSEKLRTSHLVEVAVIDEVRKATGLVVERVFWRFPVTVLGKEEMQEDLYLAQGYQRHRREEGYTVAETSLQQFEEAVSSLRAPEGSSPRQR